MKRFILHQRLRFNKLSMVSDTGMYLISKSGDIMSEEKQQKNMKIMDIS